MAFFGDFAGKKEWETLTERVNSELFAFDGERRVLEFQGIGSQFDGGDWVRQAWAADEDDWAGSGETVLTEGQGESAEGVSSAESEMGGMLQTANESMEHQHEQIQNVFSRPWAPAPSHHTPYTTATPTIGLGPTYNNLPPQRSDSLFPSVGGQQGNENFVEENPLMPQSQSSRYQEAALGTGVNGSESSGEAEGETDSQSQSQRELAAEPAKVNNRNRKRDAKDEKDAETVAWVTTYQKARESIIEQGREGSLAGLEATYNSQKVHYTADVWVPKRQYDIASADPKVAKAEQKLSNNGLSAHRVRCNNRKVRFEAWQLARYWVREAGRTFAGSVDFHSAVTFKPVEEDWIRCSGRNTDPPVRNMGWVKGVWVK